jgi:hypothetical protein
VRIRLREERELRAVDLKPVDLLVMKRMGGAKEFSACTAQAGVGGKRSVFGEPGADGALRNVAMEALA